MKQLLVRKSVLFCGKPQKSPPANLKFLCWRKAKYWSQINRFTLFASHAAISRCSHMSLFIYFLPHRIWYNFHLNKQYLSLGGFVTVNSEFFRRTPLTSFKMLEPCSHPAVSSPFHHDQEEKAQADCLPKCGRRISFLILNSIFHH